MTGIRSFDLVACAALHNEIVGRITVAAHDQYDDIIVHNYFNAFDKANEVRERLSEKVVTFLENIERAAGELHL